MMRVHSIFKDYSNRFKVVQFLGQEIEKKQSKENKFDRELEKALGHSILLRALKEQTEKNRWLRA